MKHSYRQIKHIISYTILYALMSIFLVLGYSLMLSGIGIIFNDYFLQSNSTIMAITFFILAIFFIPFRNFLKKSMDRFFYNQEYFYQSQLQSFSDELTNKLELPKITNILRQYINRTFKPDVLHIFIFNSQYGQYNTNFDPSIEITSDIHFNTNSLLVRTLSQDYSPLIIHDIDKISPNLEGDQFRIKLLGTNIFIPIPGGQRLMGWLTLHLPQSGKHLSTDQLAYMEALCDQAATAIERTQVIRNLENRVQEMDVLANIIKGVNATLSLNEILELIYAQTIKIIPANDFRIVLLDDKTGTLINLIYIIQDKRHQKYEKKSYSGEMTLDNVVIKNKQSILTDDFINECSKHGLTSTDTEILNFISAPLFSGVETIGALSVGNRSTSMSYNSEHLKLLEAIANQVAGAIIKTRLLQETDKKALQFSFLYNVSRQLTSTLDLEPLLQSILKGAVDILNCESGSLLMVDEQSNDLVFKVTVGPVASELLNQHIPFGVGIAGKAINSKKPVLVNNIQTAKDWYSKTDQKTGYQTEGLLAIPILVKENVIGVIEILNKMDGSPFNLDDQELMQSFAAQAAVAIENARLYYLTDQELSARVEELSVMQRIDRELNASLDTNQPMRITLDWAMSQSKSSAGFVGIVQDNGIRVMASQGYTNELDIYQESLLPINDSDINLVIIDGIPQNVKLNGEKKSEFLNSAQYQTIIPIRRENSTIGILFLESVSSHPISDDIMNFLIRLSDHASIAISNAELYAKVQSANVAKSEFVSFVSHELKNPMTSIKGYSELLGAGAVGPINEAQANFLLTIKNNVQRMATLVSDLADVSRIEAGRMKFEYMNVSLNDITEEVVRSFHNQINEKKQKLSVILPTNLPSVWADRNRVIQILTNLVSNSNKYTPEEGKIIITADANDNKWDQDGSPQVVHISVKDSGFGIDIQDQPKIFQKFFRTDVAKESDVPGTGLGLNISKYLVEMQGGRIWFESELDRGTTFHFTLPIVE